MKEQEQAKPFRPSLHVEFCFWIAWLLVTIGLPLLFSLLFFVYGLADNALVVALVFLGTFLFLHQLAYRRCSSERLTVHDGLRYVAAYMTVGVSGFSFIVTVLSTMMAIVITDAIVVMSFFGSDATRAGRQFYSMVLWFSRHRMYQ